MTTNVTNTIYHCFIYLFDIHTSHFIHIENAEYAIFLFLKTQTRHLCHFPFAGQRRLLGRIHPIQFHSLILFDTLFDYNIRIRHFKTDDDK